MGLRHNILLVTQKRLEHDSCDLKTTKNKRMARKSRPQECQQMTFLDLP